jgi:hypothetical protein
LEEMSPSIRPEPYLYGKGELPMRRSNGQAT